MVPVSRWATHPDLPAAPAVTAGPAAELLVAQLAGLPLRRLRLGGYRMLPGIVASVADALPGLQDLALEVERVERHGGLELTALPRLARLERLTLRVLSGPASAGSVTVAPLPAAATALRQLGSLNLEHVRPAEGEEAAFWGSLAALPLRQLEYRESSRAVSEPPAALLCLAALTSLRITVRSCLPACCFKASPGGKDQCACLLALQLPVLPPMPFFRPLSAYSCVCPPARPPAAGGFLSQRPPSPGHLDPAARAAPRGAACPGPPTGGQRGAAGPACLLVQVGTAANAMARGVAHLDRQKWMLPDFPASLLHSDAQPPPPPIPCPRLPLKELHVSGCASTRCWHYCLQLPEGLAALAPTLRRLELPCCSLRDLPEELASLTGLLLSTAQLSCPT